MFLLVPAHPGFPGQIPQSRKTVVCLCVLFTVVLFVVTQDHLHFVSGNHICVNL